MLLFRLYYFWPRVLLFPLLLGAVLKSLVRTFWSFNRTDSLFLEIMSQSSGPLTEKKQVNGRLSNLLTNVVDLHGCPPSPHLPIDTRFFSQVLNRKLVVIVGAAQMWLENTQWWWVVCSGFWSTSLKWQAERTFTVDNLLHFWLELSMVEDSVSHTEYSASEAVRLL